MGFLLLPLGKRLNTHCMASNLIPIKLFLGKYYTELAYSAIQEKYLHAGLDTFFDQRYIIQANKAQMIVNPAMSGLSVIITGNELQVSKELYENPNIVITNSMELPADLQHSPKSLYTADTFSTIAYLVCQNHTMFHITGELEEPIYVRYSSEFEAFYNSVVVFNIACDLDIEIVEEIESHCAVNVVINYIVQHGAALKLTTFYQNHFSAVSFCLRNVVVREGAKYIHVLFGKGSANVLDENKILAAESSSVELLGCVSSKQEFHSVIVMNIDSYDNFLLDYRHVAFRNGSATLTPVVVGNQCNDRIHSDIRLLSLSDVDSEQHLEKSLDFIKDIADRAVTDRNTGIERFYKNKLKFLRFQ